MKKVSIKINESTLLKNLKFAFSNSFTVVTELLQNARRAGATEIIMTTSVVNDETVLLVQDNGCGIDDFQKLLTVAESGWNDSVKQDESPFGMGFLSALFAARKVVVESRGRTLDMDTEHCLSMDDIHIQPVSDFIGDGTRVTLVGVDNKVVNKDQIESLVQGFPINVVLNGEALRRPYSLDGDSFFLTDIGWVHCNPEKEITAITQTFTGYLQGFRVISNISGIYNGSATIHLDPKKFFGRMPDRDKLVDQPAAMAIINKTMTGIYLKWCTDKLEELGGEVFSQLYGDKAFRLFPALLNKLDFVPACLLSKPERISRVDECHENQRVDINITREQLQSGEIQLIDDLSYVDEEENISVWQWLDKNDNAFMLEIGLPADHWAIDFVLELNNDDVKIEPINLGRSAVFSGNYISVGISLCDEVKMVCHGHEVIVKSSAVYAFNHGIMVPADSSDYVGDIAESIERYASEHNDFMENDLDFDSNGINDVVRRLRTQNFSKAINETLNNAGLPLIDGIQGKQYLVAFNEMKAEQKYQMDSIYTVDMVKVFAELGISEDAFKLAVQKVKDSEKITESEA